MKLIVLPTLDGSHGAALARLEAWSTAPMRQYMAGMNLSDEKATHGERQQQLSLLDVGTHP